MKEQDKIPGKKKTNKPLNKRETSNPLEAEFKTLVKRILSELSVNFNNIEKNLSAMKGKRTEMKNNLQGSNSRVGEAKNQINDIEQQEAKNNQTEQEEKRILKK